MIQRRHRWALTGVTASLAWATLLACSGGAGSQAPEGDTGGPDSRTTTADGGPASATSTMPLHLMPASTFSGSDGTHTFRVPIAVYGAADATLTASDPSKVRIEPATLADPNGDDGKYFMVTALAPGDVTLTATAHGQTATGALHISPYAASDYAVGENRYLNGADPDPACISCHSADGGIDHSPSAMAAARDNEIVGVITTGVLVEGNPITQVRHRWKVTADEARGLVTYLRALPPRGFRP